MPGDRCVTFVLFREPDLLLLRLVFALTGHAQSDRPPSCRAGIISTTRAASGVNCSLRHQLIDSTGARGEFISQRTAGVEGAAQPYSNIPMLVGCQAASRRRRRWEEADGAAGPSRRPVARYHGIPPGSDSGSSHCRRADCRTGSGPGRHPSHATAKIIPDGRRTGITSPARAVRPTPPRAPVRSRAPARRPAGPGGRVGPPLDRATQLGHRPIQPTYRDTSIRLEVEQMRLGAVHRAPRDAEALEHSRLT